MTRREVSTGLSAFRWRAATGLERLPLYDGSDVSADGSVIVSLGVRWTDAGGSQPLGDFGGGYTAALGVSPDGGVVVGYSENAAREARAFRWTAATRPARPGHEGRCRGARERHIDERIRGRRSVAQQGLLLASRRSASRLRVPRRSAGRATPS